MTGSGVTPSGQEMCGCSASDLHDRGCTPPAPAQAPPIDSSLIAAHDATADQTPVQEAGSGRQAAVEAVARELYAGWGTDIPWDDPGGWQVSWRQAAERLLSLPEVAALSQPGEPT